MTHTVPSLNDSLPDPPGDLLNASERKTGLRDGLRRFAAMALDALLPQQCWGCGSLVETGGVLCAPPPVRWTCWPWPGWCGTLL